MLPSISYKPITANISEASAQRRPPSRRRERAMVLKIPTGGSRSRLKSKRHLRVMMPVAVS
jgi:hypothetical protein